MRYPADRRGQHETLEHYLTRLESVRNNFLQSKPERQLSQFITTFKWRYFATFEFNLPFISIQAAEPILRSFFNRHRYLYSYYTVEFSPMLHCHALITSSDLDRWPYGVSDIDPVTEPNGAAYYIRQHYQAEWNLYGTDWMKWFQRIRNRPQVQITERPEIAELKRLFLSRLNATSM
jgi:hypothetical protein